LPAPSIKIRINLVLLATSYEQQATSILRYDGAATGSL